MTDVDNFAVHGATIVFGGQKVQHPCYSLADRLRYFVGWLDPQVIDMDGAGAGVRMAAGLVAFAEKIVSGIETRLDLLDFDDRAKSGLWSLAKDDRPSALAGMHRWSQDEHLKALWRICGSLKMTYRISQLGNIQAVFPIIALSR